MHGFQVQGGKVLKQGLCDALHGKGTDSHEDG